MKLYGMQESGNCWKVAQILSLTRRRFEWVRVDSNAGHTRTPAFLAINPLGKVPVLVTDDATVLTESNAILLHYAHATPWLAPAGLPRTRVHEWLFFEQYSHEPYIAVARKLRTMQPDLQASSARLQECAEKGALALSIMERRLSTHPWLAGDAPTIADLALFAYTHRADEGGFALERWPGLQAWLARTAALPGITEMPRAGATETATAPSGEVL